MTTLLPSILSYRRKHIHTRDARENKERERKWERELPEGGRGRERVEVISTERRNDAAEIEM
jgi:hypothetical protein